MTIHYNHNNSKMTTTDIIKIKMIRTRLIIITTRIMMMITIIIGIKIIIV